MGSTRRHRARPAAVLALALVAAAPACGDDDDGGSPATGTGDGGGGADATLEVTGFAFDDVTAPAGGTLEIVNSSGGRHTFTADDDSFSEDLPDGETVTVTVPAGAGDYAFHCNIHPSMQATLTVE